MWKRLRRWFRRVFLGKIECVKPTGTVSMLAETSSGIHPIFDLRYTRKCKMKSEPTLVREETAN